MLGWAVLWDADHCQSNDLLSMQYCLRVILAKMCEYIYSVCVRACVCACVHACVRARARVCGHACTFFRSQEGVRVGKDAGI